MRTPILVLAFASAAVAQGVVSPSHFTTAEGNSYGYSPFGSTTTPDRYLQVHDDLAGTPRTIRSISLRRDGSTFSNFAAYSMLVDVVLSNAATTADTISTTFDSNHGSNKATVAQFKLVQFPSTDHGSTRGFDYKIPFDQPFNFNGTGSLAWEMRVTSRTNPSTYYFDYAYSTSTNPAPYYWSYGTGCKATTYSNPMSISGSSSANWTGGSVTLSYFGNYFPKNALVTLLLGAQDKTFGGAPLPFEIPGTNGFPSGKCFLYLDPLITIPQLTNAQGQLTANIGAGVNTGNNGNVIFVQSVALDTQANAFGLVTSNMVQHQVIAPWTTIRVSNVYATSSVGGTGTIQKNQSYVIRID